VLLALGLAIGCSPAGDDAKGGATEALAARLDELEAKIADLDRGLSEESGVSARLDGLERRLEEMARSNLEMYDDTVDQILQLRDHVTLQLGKIHKDTEKDRIREMTSGDREALVSMLREGGVDLDLESRTVRVRGSICLTEGLVEFLAVGHGGKDHESVLYLDCTPSLLNAAFLSLGLDPGNPFHVEEKNPNPPAGGIPFGPKEEGLLYYPPSGPAVYVYVEWEGDAGKVRRRAEDLLLNRNTGESMERAGWVYLGSRFAPDDRSGEELYVADVTQDMISIWHSYRGNTILDSPLPEGMEDDVYVANTGQLPERGTAVEVVFALEPLED
jgi:hypothetical protein